MLRFRQERRSPIQDGETDDVDKKVRERNDPDKLIAKDLLDDKGAKFGPGFAHWRAALRALHLWKTNRRRRIGQREPDEDNATERDQGRDKKTKTPIDDDQVAAKDDDQSATDRVRGIPNRHFCRELAGRKPMGQEPGARRKPHSLKPTIGYPDETQNDRDRVQAEEQIEDGGCSETKRHEDTSVRAIPEKSIRELRNAVEQTMKCQ